MSDVPVALLVAVAVVGIVLAATLSAGEVAVLRVTRARVAELEAERPGAAARVRRLVEDPARVAQAASFVRLLGEMTATVSITLAISAGSLSWWATALLAVAACAVVAFLLVRVSPRSTARRHPVGVLAALSRLLLVTTALAGGVGRRSPTVGSAVEHDDAELRDMVERVSESEAIEDEEREMFRSVLELGDTLTREVMVPRTDMITTHADTPLHKVLALLLRSGYSRVPVVGESVDEVVGVLYLKDVVRRLRPSRPRTPRTRWTRPRRPSRGPPCSCPSRSRSTTCCASCATGRATSRSSSTSTAASPASSRSRTRSRRSWAS
ncbi:CBS domain-containing protein [Cellulomonas sp. JZ18]|uniref:CBS domain-containing protein n=1 Tax=Cellulomonas sp. JZ18 TaxID=2654191 RepID=UPI001E3D7422|nr:CBS domain-containing protein [Cellulomonas sp. JZ18]